MSAEAIGSVLRLLLNIEGTFQTDYADTNAYDRIFRKLGEIVQKSAKDESYRNQLANSEELWARLKAVVRNAQDFADIIMKDREIASNYVRTLRGLMLLMRNMSACNQQLPQQLELHNECIITFLQVAQLNPGIDEMVTSYYTISVSFLHNITKEMSNFETMMLDPLMRFLSYPSECLKGDQELSYCYATLFLNLTANDDFLYRFFKGEFCNMILHDCLLQGITKQHTIIFSYLDKERIAEEAFEITSLDAVMLRIFSRFAVNESFSPYFISLEIKNGDMFFEVLKCLQLCVTSSERWDKFELTTMMTWCFSIFKETAESTISYLETKSKDEQKAVVLHSKLTMTLDIISTVAQYDQVQNYLLSYDALETLIDLLRALQNSLIRINFYRNPNGTVKGIKTTDAVGSKLTDEKLLAEKIDYINYQIKSTNFPECKLLIIEILTMLVCNRREVQDKIRELGGLQLVLSNCVIDDNDPFIKERSVVCIKFLLNDNAANQDFVAKLEAKKVVPDDTLSAAGYEVKINNTGELRLNMIDEKNER